jgi:hypothetical protein
LASTVSEVKATDPREGYKWNRFDWDAWDAAIQGARSKLTDLWESILESRAVGYNPDRAA